MAIIRPFQGVRYNQAKIGSLDAVVTPPYDVISPEEQEQYYSRHPNNVIRLILPREEGPAKYESAASHLYQWLETGVLVRDLDPALYIVVQEYEIRGERKKRIGLTCLVRLEEFESGKVLPHENIMSKPLEDRLNMIRTTKANFDSVFGLYSDGRTDKVVRPFVTTGEPIASAVDRDGVRSDLYRISQKEAMAMVADILANEAIVIADGHHRYTAALAYRDEMRSLVGSNPEAPHEYVMMTLVSLEDPGLIILPTHRLVGNLDDFDTEAFLEKANELFDLVETRQEELEAAVERMAGEKYVYGLYLGKGRSYIMKLKPDVKPEVVVKSPGSDALKRLDVSVLHSVVLDQMLGIDTQRLSSGSNITYTRDCQSAIQAVDEGNQQIFFIMNPTKVEEVKAVAAAGDRMPQKSTYFYPKLPTGMVMRVWGNL